MMSRPSSSTSMSPSLAFSRSCQLFILVVITLVICFLDGANVGVVAAAESLSTSSVSSVSAGSSSSSSAQSVEASRRLQEQQQRQQQEEGQDFLLFYGNVVDTQGQPVGGAVVQFWHTDGVGRYNHPSDIPFGSQLEYLDVFSYMGTSVCDDVTGQFYFKTYRPGKYSGRPITHIHFKVWNKPSASTTSSAAVGELLLTSQFYFSDDEIAQQRVVDDLLLLNLTEIQLETEVTNNSTNSTSIDGVVGNFTIVDVTTTTTNSTNSTTNTTTTVVNATNSTSNMTEVEDDMMMSAPTSQVFSITKQIVVAIPGSTSTTLLRPTPFQAEGPFYPVIDFFNFSNDMTTAFIDATSTPDVDGQTLMEEPVMAPATATATTKTSQPQPSASSSSSSSSSSLFGLTTNLMVLAIAVVSFV